MMMPQEGAVEAMSLQDLGIAGVWGPMVMAAQSRHPMFTAVVDALNVGIALATFSLTATFSDLE